MGCYGVVILMSVESTYIPIPGEIIMPLSVGQNDDRGLSAALPVPDLEMI